MNKKALKIGIYDKSGSLVLEKCPVTIDAIAGALQICPEGGYVKSEICDLPSDSAV